MLTADDIRAAGDLLELKHPGLLRDAKVKQWTVIHFVAAFGSEEHMIHFCKTCPQACLVVTADGLTPYLVALIYNNIKTASILLSFNLF